MSNNSTKSFENAAFMPSNLTGGNMRFYYRFKFYLNAKHSVNLGGRESAIHPHTWEIELKVRQKTNRILNFTTFEKDIDEYFESYEGKYLNDIYKFKNMDATMENLGTIFIKELKDLLNDKNFELLELSINENPTRKYILEGDE